ncbi:hypothetical protein EV360DRAFT_57131 [Lentinula raphanica]|nr:hypothetical protein EV360DRAFT_57131 [Lentinula raphanica]
MPRATYHSELMHKFLSLSLLSITLDVLDDLNFEEYCDKLLLDLETIQIIRQTCYLRGRKEVAKAGSIHLAWTYAESGDLLDEGRFINMLRVSPLVFDVIMQLIQEHHVFQNRSHKPQSPVDYQLTVTLYRMGRFGNAASLEDIARISGCSEGSKEKEKEWIDQQMGFVGLWRDGWVMYDGTIVPLYAAPQWIGEAYYTRKSNYGLNVQVSRFNYE